MKIVVCVKQVPDPEGPRSGFVINEEDRKVEPSGIPPVLNSFDKNALEAALRLKDAIGSDVHVTILTLGHKISTPVMLKAIAPGADDIVKVNDPLFAGNLIDSHATSAALAAAVSKIGEVDLIMVGQQAADFNAGQVGFGLAHQLDLPIVSLARNVEVQGDGVLVERGLLTGYEKVKCPTPAVVMFTSEIGLLRYPSLPKIKAAKKKPVTSYTAADLGIENPAASNKLILRQLSAPPSNKRGCTLIEGETGAEAGRKLAERMKQEGIV